MTDWVYNDGGRKAAGYKGTAGDCGVRAIAIATGLEYAEAYALCREAIRTCKLRVRAKFRSQSPREGMYRKEMEWAFEQLGWEWIGVMKIGSGCVMRACVDELPVGRLVLRLSRHYAASIDGIVYDTYDSTRDGTRCVYGYWREK